MCYLRAQYMLVLLLGVLWKMQCWVIWSQNTYQAQYAVTSIIIISGLFSQYLVLFLFDLRKKWDEEGVRQLMKTALF